MMKCPCDEFEHPPELSIPAGLATIPRQVAGFPEFRRAMLAAIRRYPALHQWRARSSDDFGVMLLEMWAYVADVQAFYDEVLAHEAYLRTARRQPSLRLLTGLLGYVPRPAVAATVSLAVLADGRQPLLLPPGVAFRSAAFDGEAPQVFELDVATTIHPQHNRWPLAAPPQQSLIPGGTPALYAFDHLLMASNAALNAEDRVLVQAGIKTPQATSVTSAAKMEGVDGRRYTRVDFATAVNLPGNTNPQNVTVKKSNQAGGLWSAPPVSGDPSIIAGNRIVLDSLYRMIKTGQNIILEKEGEYRWFQVVGTQEVQMTTSPSRVDTVQNANGGNISVAVPAVKTPATELSLERNINDSPGTYAAGGFVEVAIVASPLGQSGGMQAVEQIGPQMLGLASGPPPKATQPVQGGDIAAIQAIIASLDWTVADAPDITLHHAFIAAGQVMTENKTSIAPGDPLQIDGSFEVATTGETPSTFLVEDKNEAGLELGGSLNASTGLVTPDQDATWSPPFTTPVTLFGNVVQASRGETVAQEILGSGDGLLPNQTFTLKKSPLTYVSSPTAGNEQGVASTLMVWADGRLWREEASFFHATPEDEVYIVRQDEEGKSLVIFGDGVHGARLPTGVNNVLASYRHGAGKAAPPAGAITQLAKPAKGLTGVKSPVAAIGGDDAESFDQIQDYAPQSALLLGRAISMADMEAVAAGVPGVRAVAVEWRWNDMHQRPVIQVWYIGDSNIKQNVSQMLHTLSEPTTPIAVEVALPIPLSLALDIEIDERYLEEDVLPQVRAALTEPEAGLLAPEQIGIGRPLYRSQVFAVVNSIEGVVCVRGILLDMQGYQPWTDYALKSPAGKYYDIEAGELLLNGEEPT